MVLVPVSIGDNKSKSSAINLEDALYFPELPVNLIRIVCVVGTYTDIEGTFIKTSQFSSEFSWDFSKDVKIIYHGDSYIPDISVTKPTLVWRTFTLISTCYQGLEVPRFFFG